MALKFDFRAKKNNIILISIIEIFYEPKFLTALSVKARSK